MDPGTRTAGELAVALGPRTRIPVDVVPAGPGLEDVLAMKVLGGREGPCGLVIMPLSYGLL